jgi:AcrR family transcriptional regulator
MLLLVAVGLLTLRSPLGAPGRPDNSSRRRAAAERRQRILETASELFATRGYAATTMAEIATAAGVALDTIYDTIGTKPQLFRLLIETAISGIDQPVAVLDRDYIAKLRAEPDPVAKLAIYATALSQIHARLAPLYLAARSISSEDPELVEIWEAMHARRARNMPLLIEHLQSTGALRTDTTIAAAADTVWAINSTEVYLLLRDQRGWTDQQYRAWLARTLARLLLNPGEAQDRR